MSGRFTLRRRGMTDDAFLLEVFTDSTATQFASLPPAQRQQIIKSQFDARERQYRQIWPDANDEIVIVDGKACGRRLWHQSETELRLIDIALLSVFQGSGIGASLIRDLQRHSDFQSKPLRLSVMTANPARRLFRRLGFSDNGRDEIYLHMEYSPRPG